MNVNDLNSYQKGNTVLIFAERTNSPSFGTKRIGLGEWGRAEGPHTILATRTQHVQYAIRILYIYIDVYNNVCVCFFVLVYFVCCLFEAAIYFHRIS